MLELTVRGGIGAWLETDIEVKRSRFICRLERVETEAQARASIEAARRKYTDARHHCSAFVLGSASAPDQIRRSNDDGEPSGTAGRPIMEVLNGRNMIDCVVVVTRYFGGTLLGTGGLIRAYSDAAISAIDEAAASKRLVSRQLRELYRLSLRHADAGRVESELRQHGVVVVGTRYESWAVMTLACEPGGEPALATLVAGITAGNAVLEPAGSEWVDVDVHA